MSLGQYAHDNGLVGLSHRGFCIDGSHHLANVLKANMDDSMTKKTQVRLPECRKYVEAALVPVLLHPCVPRSSLGTTICFG